MHDVKITQDAQEAAYFAKNNIPYIVHLHPGNSAEQFPDGAYCVERSEDVDEELCERVYRRFEGIPWDIAETDRLRIREITVEDVPRLYELYADERVARFAEPLFSDRKLEEEYTRGYIRNIYGFYGFGMWVIEEKQSGEVIGRVGFEYKDRFEGLELGFVLGAAYQHKGYAYEACRAALEYGVNKLGQKDYCAFVDESNTASIRLCERLGFAKGGVARLPEIGADGIVVEKELWQYLLAV